MSFRDKRTCNELAFIRSSHSVSTTPREERSCLDDSQRWSASGTTCDNASQSKSSGMADDTRGGNRGTNSCGNGNAIGNTAIVSTFLRGLPALLVVSLRAIVDGEELLLTESNTASSTGGTLPADDANAHYNPYCSAPVRYPCCALATSSEQAISEHAQHAQHAQSSSDSTDTACQDAAQEGAVATSSCVLGGGYKKVSVRWSTAPKVVRKGAKDSVSVAVGHRSCLQPATTIRPVTCPSHPAFGQVH